MNNINITLLHRFDDFLEKSLYYISGFLLITIACLVFYSVTMRYVFNSPPLWADEAPRAFFVWMTYLGIAVATKRGQNIRVTHFINKISAKPRLFIETIMHTLVLIMLVTLVVYNIPILELQKGGNMLSTGWSYVWMYAPVSVGCALMVFYQSRLMVRTILNYKTNQTEGV